MNIDEILDRFEGKPLDIETLSQYDKWALSYFHDRTKIVDPNVEITFQMDISSAEANYRANRSDAPGASLTAWLIWSLLQALKRHPCFLWREIDGRWYEFANLPLYFPVATGTPSRYQDVVIDNASNMSWREFAGIYRKEVDIALEGKPFEPIPDGIWHLMWLVGNMRQLSFSSLKVFSCVIRSGRPVFYFGKRYMSEGRLMLPVYVMLDHATAEPERLDALLTDYKKLMVS